MKLFSYIITACILLASINSVLAQDGQEMRKIDAEKLTRIVDNNTFFTQNNLDRMYFAPDKSIKQQINQGWNNLAPGTILTGSWDIDKDNQRLCWQYDKATVNQYKVLDKKLCYDVYSDAPDDTFMTLHSERFVLFQVGDDGISSLSPSFDWDRWAYDNYIIEPSFVPTLKQALVKMREYRDAGGIPGGTINRADLQPRMQQYYDETIGKVFFIGENLMYFGKNGGYFSTSESRIKEANKNIDELTKPERFGKWTMKDDIHCYARLGDKGNCEFVAPAGKGLIRPYQGILGFHNNGFGRVHGEMAVGHIPASETSFPELFKKVDEIFNNQ